MKKHLIISTILVLSLLAIVFLPAARTSKLKPNQHEVVFWTLQMNDFAPYMNGVINEFEAQNPDVKIKWIDVPFSEGEKRTLAAILSDNPPDLINLNPDFSAILAQKGALQKINEDDMQDFNEEIINSLKYKDELYAIPWYATSAITIYNKKLYEKAGFSDPPETYKKLGKIALKIRKETGAYAFMPTITENDTMLKLLNKYGVDSWSNINSAEAVNVFDYYKELYSSDLIPKESITETQREALEKYMSGQIVFFQSGANFLNMIKENAPSIYENTDVSKQIVGSLGQNDFSLMNLVIPLRAQQKDDALKFALFLTNEENQLKLAKLTNVIATNKKALKDDFYTKRIKGDLMSKARYLSAKQLNKIQPVLKQDKGQKEVNIILSTAVQQILLNQGDTQAILDDVSKKWKNLSD